MTSERANLLSRLGGPFAQRSAAAPAGQVENSSSADFAQMLRKAQEGGLESGLRVEVSRSSGVELSEDQLTRLSAAADRAEAMGITRAVAFIDGQAVVLEVQTRTVSARFDPSKDVLTGIDGVLGIPPAPGAASVTPAGGVGGAEGLVRSLLDLPKAPLDLLARLAGG